MTMLPFGPRNSPNYEKLYRLAHKKKQRRYQRFWARERRAKNRTEIREYLRRHPCIDCGETDIVVLQFDHMKNKLFNICHSYGRSLKVLWKEIAKCQVRCANCHIKRHHRERSGHFAPRRRIP